MIMVHYKDKSFAFVPNNALDYLLATKSIVAFRRSSGWVDVGRETLRKKRAPTKYEGEERRDLSVKMNCLTCNDFVVTMCRIGKCPTRIYMQGKYS